MKFDKPWLRQPLSRLEIFFDVALVLAVLGLFTVAVMWGR